MCIISGSYVPVCVCMFAQVSSECAACIKCVKLFCYERETISIWLGKQVKQKSCIRMLGVHIAQRRWQLSVIENSFNKRFTTGTGWFLDCTCIHIYKQTFLSIICCKGMCFGAHMPCYNHPWDRNAVLMALTMKAPEAHKEPAYHLWLF